MDIDFSKIQVFIEQYRFYIIVVLMIIVYRMGFARRLPILKNVIIYTVLVIGCIPLTILHVLGLPIIASLSIAAIVLVIVRIRQKNYNPPAGGKRGEANGS